MSQTENRDMAMARAIAAAVNEQGGRVFYVGGFVRDRLMGRPGKDVDIEVHGISPDDLASILDSLGERITIGASFGIFSLRHYDLDIAMPRQEKAVGKGHRDFEVFVDPFIGTERAALRRDFTVNAMMEDVLTGQVTDHFGGQADLENRVLRHVNPLTFAEDPLRVLRGAQFAARFGFSVHPDTVELCSTMELSALPRERIMGELEKALTKADRPSVFFSCLAQMEQLGFWFSELRDSERWNELMAVLDSAAALRHNVSRPLRYMIAALCAPLSADSAASLLNRLTGERELTEYALNMPAKSAELKLLLDKSAEQYDFNRLFDSALCPEELPELCRARFSGAFDSQLCRERLEGYTELMKMPQVMGRDLIAAGMKPDRSFSACLEYAHDLHLRGVPKDEALRRTLENAAACRAQQT